MAEENLVTNIVAKSDFSDLIGDLNKVSSRLVELQQQLNVTNKTLAVQAAGMQKAFAATLRSTDQFSTHFVSLSSDVDKFGKNLDSGKMKLGQYYKAWQEHARTSGGLVRDLAKQQVQMQNAILQPLGKNAQGLMQFNVHVPRGLDVIKNKTAIAAQEMKIMNKVIQDGANQVINWGKNTQWAGRQLSVGLTLPLAAFGKTAADAFKQADQELVRLTKVYGGVAATSAQELSRIRKEVASTAKELASSYGAAYNETISLAADIAATGKQGADLIASTKETTRLAVLGEVDRQEAMKATLAIQTAFKQNTEGLSQSIDFLNAVENQTSTSLSDLVEAIPKAGPVIQAMGGSIKDLALYLTAMREGGINASEGANALKSALASLINPTNVAKEMFKGFGIDLGGIVTRNAGNLTGTIMELQGALDRLDPLKKQQAIEQLFGKFQFARMNALFQNLGKQGSQTLQVLDLMKASSQDLANIAGRELAQVTESASGKYKRAIESLKADLASVGEQFLKIGTMVVRVLDGVIKFFDKLPDPIKTVMGFVGGLTALTGPVIMLTGLLANFFGYIAKGLFHLKSFAKGGQAFKLLTPDILAAEKAGTLFENSLYNDAQAASVLKQAVAQLREELQLLETKANSARVAVGPAISTVAGNVIVPGAERVVDPNHPLVNKMGTRQFAHLNPVAGMNEQQRISQTIFGVVPNPNAVNQKIGPNPQAYMSGDLEKIQGVTSIKGISTGIVASEAAKWHAMTGALSMQSEQEIAALKREVIATGTITSELSGAYQALLPQMSEITSMAAQETALIVKELHAGKLTVDAARAKIISLNATVEAMMVETTQAIATSQGRIANITTVPLTNQPVVNPVTGKTNMKEMFHKPATANLIQKISNILGVRTSGGGYSIETTKPRKLNSGGAVYLSGGSQSPIVPGPNVNADVVPAMLTPGEFVVNADATRKNLPLLQQINGQGSNGPMYNAGSNGYIRTTEYETVDVGRTTNLTPAEMSRLYPGFKGSKGGYRVKGTAGIYVGDVTDPQLVNKYPHLAMNGVIGRQSINKALEEGGVMHDLLLAGIKANKGPYRTSTDQFIDGLVKAGLMNPADGKQLADQAFKQYEAHVRKAFLINDNNNPLQGASNAYFKRYLPPEYDSLWKNYSSAASHYTSMERRSTVAKSVNLPGPDGKMIPFGRLRGTAATGSFLHARTPTSFLSRLAGLGISEKTSRELPFNFSRDIPLRRNRGGVIGLNSGGRVPGYQRGGLIAQNLMSIAGSMGGGMLGSMIGGPAGMMVGSMLGGMLPMMGAGRSADKTQYEIPQKSILGNTKYSASLKDMATSSGRLSGALGRLMLGVTKMNLAIGAGTIALSAAYKIWQDHKESLRLTALSYGMTAEAAQKAGVKYVDYNTKIKDSISNMKLMLDKNRLIVESIRSAGTPFKMTIEEYKKLQKEIKTTMSDQVKMFDKTSFKNVSNVALQLKQQFMAAGMSAEEATKKIYTMISMSNKSSVAGTTIAGAGFASMDTAQEASVGAFKSFNTAAKFGDATAQAAALNTALMSVDAGIASIVKTTEDKAKKDKTTFDASKAQYAAENEMINLINDNVKSQKTLSYGVLEELKKQNPEIRSFANESDTALSIWQKLQISAAGFAGDLSKIGAEGTASLYKMTNSIENAVIETNKGGVLKGQYDNLQKLQGQAAKAAKSALGQSVKQQISDKDAIKAIDKKIAAINKESDARIKALRKEQEAESYTTDIKKKQLDYQNALAAGDMSRAAQAQLDIKQAISARQATLTEEALTNLRDRKIAPLEKQKEAINNKQQAMADSAALASENLDSLNKKISDQKDKIDTVNSAMTQYAIAQQTHTGNLKDLLLVVNKALKDAGLSGGYTELGKVKSAVEGSASYLKNKKAFLGTEDYISPNTSLTIAQIAEKDRGTGPSNVYTGKLPNLGKLPKTSSKISMPKGGLASPAYNIPSASYSSMPSNTSSTGIASQSTYAVNVILNGSNMDPNDVAKVVINNLQKLEVRSGRSRSK